MSLEFLTLKEAAAKSRVGLSTLNTLLARGEDPALTRIGGRVFVRTDCFDAWLEKRTEVGHARCRPCRVPARPCWRRHRGALTPPRSAPLDALSATPQ